MGPLRAGNFKSNSSSLSIELKFSKKYFYKINIIWAKDAILMSCCS